MKRSQAKRCCNSDASGMLPIDPTTNNYSAEMVASSNKPILFERNDKSNWRYSAPKGYRQVKMQVLTPEGSSLDASGHLKAGIPVCPPEGDAGTGMVATNAVKQRTGNVSAGTSLRLNDCIRERLVQAIIVLSDMVTTPDGSSKATALQ